MVCVLRGKNNTMWQTEMKQTANKERNRIWQRRIEENNSELVFLQWKRWKWSRWQRSVFKTTEGKTKSKEKKTREEVD